jgi:hypothetical protein
VTAAGESTTVYVVPLLPLGSVVLVLVVMALLGAADFGR